MSEAIDAAAARWFAAQGSSDMDWEGFTAWLEADPRHRQAFDAIALLDAAIDAQRVSISALLAEGSAQDAPVPDATPARERWRWAGFGAGALAAGLAALVFVPRPPAPDQVWRTEGGSQTIALADDARVVLAPRSRLVALAGDRRRLSLDGAAYFDVAHRPDRALSITAGGYEVRDIGTRFEISSAPSATRVAVAEGQVSVTRGDAPPIRLGAGKSLVARGSELAVSTVSAGQVASWRRGTLVYSHVALALVADDVTRYSGTPVTVDPAIADRPFSGALTVGEGAGPTNALAAIPDVRIRRDAHGIRLEPGRSGG